ncbi:MAG: hypothetical protein AAF740_04775 [Bacteroidota bacterium]
MMKTLFAATLIFLCALGAFAQKVQRYQNAKGDSHLCGVFPIETLEEDTVFQKWYKKGYEDFALSGAKPDWAKTYKNMEVEIYLGTWCGDSKEWVPRFVKLWDELGMKREQLQFTALYYGVDGKYKQGPNGEEKGKKIHRVPTFIFKQDGKEVARMVESPVNDLETDLAQIALGYPSKPNYRGASYLLDLFEEDGAVEDETKQVEHFYEVYDLISSSSELNTLGHVLLEAGKTEEAVMTFYFNTLYFQYEPRVYKSYAEALAKAGKKEDAIQNYEKVLLLDRNNEEAREELRALKYGEE